jgi:hypothetical protein
MYRYIDTRWLLGFLALTGVVACSSDDDSESDGAGADSLGTSVTALECDTRRAAQAALVKDDITADTTWSGVVYVERSIDVRQATLTIAPGTSIVMGANAELGVGAEGSTAALDASGTSEAPIRFCGGEERAGYWGSLLIREGVAEDSVLANVLVSEGGGIATHDAAVSFESGIHVDNLQVQNSGKAGVYATSFAADSQRLSVQGSAGAAVVLEGAAAVTAFPRGGTIADNGEDVVRLTFTDIDEDMTVHELDVPYVQAHVVSTNEANLVFEAGTDYRFAAGAGLEIGSNRSVAAIHVNGTAEKPVRMGGEIEDAGSWAGLVIRGNVSADSELRHLALSHAGSADSASLVVQAPITVDHVSLSDNTKGVRIDAQGLKEGSVSLSVTRSGAPPLTVEADALVSLPQDSAFTGNTSDYVAVLGGDYTKVGTVLDLGVPYRVLGSIETQGGSSLTLAPGTEFVMSEDTILRIGDNGGSAALTAEGTAEAPIRFVGLEPVAGYWGGLELGSNMVSSSHLSYVEIQHGGGSTMGACLRLSSAIQVENSSFSNCAGFGLLHATGDLSDYAVSNTFDANVSGAVGIF